MNNLWKKSWREHAKAEQETHQMNGLSSGASIIDAAKAVHPSSKKSEGEILQKNSSPRKRAVSDATYAGAESKRPRFETSTSLEGAGFLKVTEPTLQEYVITYPQDKISPDSTLLQELRSRVKPKDSLWPYIHQSEVVLSELGRCASDLVWRAALEGPDRGGSDASLSRDQAMIQQIVRDWKFVLPNLNPESRNCNVSRKFQVLVASLRAFSPHGPNFKGVLVVKNQDICTPLSELLYLLRLELPFLRPVVITHGQPYDDGLLTKGVHNFLITAPQVLVSTSEHIDCFIFFDEGDPTLLQSLRAELRDTRTHLVHLLERNDHPENRHAAVADDTLLSPSPDFLEDPTTGRRIYPNDASKVITSLIRLKCPSQEGSIITTSHSTLGYTCTVSLPGIPSIEGALSPSLDNARRSASYEACKCLFKLGLLDYPQFCSPPPVDQVGEILVQTRQPGAKVYVRKSPLFWAGVEGPITNLYPLVLTPIDEEESFSPLVLLTRRPLPSIPNLELYRYLKGFTVRTCRAAPLEVKAEDLHKIYRYTVRLIRALVNKPVECPLEEMHWFLLPLTPGWNKPSQANEAEPFFIPSIEIHISWGAIELAGENFLQPLNATFGEVSSQDLDDAMLQDRWVEFTKRYAAIRARPDMTPLSKPPTGAMEADSSSFLDFVQSRIKDFKGLKNPRQLMIEATSIHSPANNLRPISRAGDSNSNADQTRFLIPELCAKCTLPASIFLTGTLIPSICHRIDDFLIVKELNGTLFDGAISEDLLLEALYTPSATRERDYERLELLGDSYLKYLSSLYVYVRNPTLSEGALHSLRQPMISNKSLFNQAWERKLPLYIQSLPFSTRQWLPPNFRWPEGHSIPTIVKEDQERTSPPAVTQEQEEEEGEILDGAQPDVGSSSKNKRKKKRRKVDKADNSHELGDKSLADSIEAIMGAAYLTGGDEIGLEVARKLGVQLDGINQWSDLAAQTAIPPHEVNSLIPLQSLRTIEEAIGRSVDRGLLSHALNPRSDTFERLEFIGDAIIDFATIKYLWHKEPAMTPGGLTLLKCAMVSNTALAAACVWAGLYQYLIHDPHVRKVAAREYLPQLEAARVKEYEIAAKEDRPPGQYWAGLECPKVFSDTLEAVVGATFISDRFSFDGVQSLFDRVLKPFFEKHVTLSSLTHHPTKNLFESLQAKGCQRFRMQKERIQGMTRCSVYLHDRLLAVGEDHVATMAARNASLAALKVLEDDSTILPSGCDCKTKAPPTKQERTAAQDICSLEEKAISPAPRPSRAPKGKQKAQVDNDWEEGMITE